MSLKKLRKIKERNLNSDGTLGCSVCHQFKSPDNFCRKDGKLTYGRCRECRRSEYDKWKKSNPGMAQKANQRWKDNIRKQCLEHYGSECIWCGEKDVGMLTLDHVNNDGNFERKNLNVYWTWHHAVKTGFPNKYQILCMGCNAYKSWYGKLPESKKKLDIRIFSLSDYAKREK